MIKKSILTKDSVHQALSTVIDPELKIDIISLGLIYGIEIEANSKVRIKLTLTTPGCPLISVIEQMVRESLSSLVEDIDRDVMIDLTFDPPWSSELMSEEARLELGL